MKHVNRRSGANDEKNWRERPIRAEEINRAQALEHIYVPQEPMWPVWAATFLAGSVDFAERPFTQFFVPADDPWPALPYGGTERQPDLSPAQQAAFELMRERRLRACGVTLGLARGLITVLDLASRCERRGCSRACACISERSREEWSRYPGPAWPPCVWSWDRAQIIRPTVERLIDRLDMLIEARLTARLGEPWAAVERIGLTHLPEEEVHTALLALFEERERRAALAEEGA